MEDTATVALIEETLSQLRPVILADGGDIRLVKFENNIVYVRLYGACVQCPISMITLKMGIEDSLKAKIPDIQEVVAID